jgi:hypothetical protein
MFNRNSKPLSKTAYYLIVSASFVVAFFVAADKLEVILAYISAILTAILLSLVRKVKQKNLLQIPWQYHFVRFLCIFLAFSFFFGMSPRLQNTLLGERLITSVVFSGMIWAGIYFKENPKRGGSG